MKILIDGVVYDSDVTDVFIQVSKEEIEQIKPIIDDLEGNIMLVSIKGLSQEEINNKIKHANTFDW